MRWYTYHNDQRMGPFEPKQVGTRFPEHSRFCLEGTLTWMDEEDLMMMARRLPSYQKERLTLIRNTRKKIMRERKEEQTEILQEISQVMKTEYKEMLSNALTQFSSEWKDSVKNLRDANEEEKQKAQNPNEQKISLRIEKAFQNFSTSIQELMKQELEEEFQSKAEEKVRLYFKQKESELQGRFEQELSSAIQNEKQKLKNDISKISGEVLSKRIRGLIRETRVLPEKRIQAVSRKAA